MTTKPKYTLSPDLLPRLPIRRPWESRYRHQERVKEVLARAAERRRHALFAGGWGDSVDSDEDRGGRGRVLRAARPRLVRRAG